LVSPRHLARIGTVSFFREQGKTMSKATISIACTVRRGSISGSRRTVTMHRWWWYVNADGIEVKCTHHCSSAGAALREASRFLVSSSEIKEARVKYINIQRPDEMLEIV